MQKKSYLLLFVLTLISGMLSGYFVNGDSLEDTIMYFIPGIILGVFLGYYFFKEYNSKISNIAPWIFISVLSCYLAISTALYSVETLSPLIGLILAGTLGALLLAIGTKFLIKNISLNEIFIISLIGGVFGSVFILPFENLFLAFSLWQMTVGVALGVFVEKNK